MNHQSSSHTVSIDVDIPPPDTVAQNECSCPGIYTQAWCLPDSQSQSVTQLFSYPLRSNGPPQPAHFSNTAAFHYEFITETKTQVDTVTPLHNGKPGNPQVVSCNSDQAVTMVVHPIVSFNFNSSSQVGSSSTSAASSRNPATHPHTITTTIYNPNTPSLPPTVTTTRSQTLVSRLPQSGAYSPSPTSSLPAYIEPLLIPVGAAIIPQISLSPLPPLAVTVKHMHEMSLETVEEEVGDVREEAERVEEYDMYGDGWDSEHDSTVDGGETGEEEWLERKEGGKWRSPGVQYHRNTHTHKHNSSPHTPTKRTRKIRNLSEHENSGSESERKYDSGYGYGDCEGVCVSLMDTMVEIPDYMGGGGSGGDASGVAGDNGGSTGIDKGNESNSGNVDTPVSLATPSPRLLPSLPPPSLLSLHSHSPSPSLGASTGTSTDIGTDVGMDMAVGEDKEEIAVTPKKQDRRKGKSRSARKIPESILPGQLPSESDFPENLTPHDASRHSTMSTSESGEYFSENSSFSRSHDSYSISSPSMASLPSSLSHPTSTHTIHTKYTLYSPLARAADPDAPLPAFLHLHAPPPLSVLPLLSDITTWFTRRLADVHLRSLASSAFLSPSWLPQRHGPRLASAVRLLADVLAVDTQALVLPVVCERGLSQQVCAVVHGVSAKQSGCVVGQVEKPHGRTGYSSSNKDNNRDHGVAVGNDTNSVNVENSRNYMDFGNDDCDWHLSWSAEQSSLRPYTHSHNQTPPSTSSSSSSSSTAFAFTATSGSAGSTARDKESVRTGNRSRSGSCGGNGTGSLGTPPTSSSPSPSQHQNQQHQHQYQYALGAYGCGGASSMLVRVPYSHSLLGDVAVVSHEYLGREERDVMAVYAGDVKRCVDREKSQSDAERRLEEWSGKAESVVRNVSMIDDNIDEHYVDNLYNQANDVENHVNNLYNTDDKYDWYDSATADDYRLYDSEFSHTCFCLDPTRCNCGVLAPNSSLCGNGCVVDRPMAVLDAQEECAMYNYSHLHCYDEYEAEYNTGVDRTTWVPVSSANAASYADVGVIAPEAGPDATSLLSSLYTTSSSVSTSSPSCSSSQHTPFSLDTVSITAHHVSQTQHAHSVQDTHHADHLHDTPQTPLTSLSQSPPQPLSLPLPVSSPRCRMADIQSDISGTEVEHVVEALECVCDHILQLRQVYLQRVVYLESLQVSLLAPFTQLCVQHREELANTLRKKKLQLQEIKQALSTLCSEVESLKLSINKGIELGMSGNNLEKLMKNLAKAREKRNMMVTVMEKAGMSKSVVQSQYSCLSQLAHELAQAPAQRSFHRMEHCLRSEAALQVLGDANRSKLLCKVSLVYLLRLEAHRTTEKADVIADTARLLKTRLADIITEFCTTQIQRHTLRTWYGRGKTQANMDFSLACVDAVHLEEAAIAPQLLRVWENPETAGPWAILIILRDGHRCIIDAPQLELMRQLYQVPVFVLYPLDGDNVTETMQSIANYAAAMTGKVPFNVVFPGLSRDVVKVSAGIPTTDHLLAPWASKPSARTHYTDILRVLFANELTKALEANARALNPSNSQITGYFIDCPRLESQSRAMANGMNEVSLTLAEHAPWEAALRVHLYLQRATWGGIVDPKAVAREILRHVRAGQLGTEWAWWWSRHGGKWGEDFGGCGLGVSGVRSRAVGVPAAIRGLPKSKPLKQRSNQPQATLQSKDSATDDTGTSGGMSDLRTAMQSLSGRSACLQGILAAAQARAALQASPANTSATVPLGDADAATIELAFTELGLNPPLEVLDAAPKVLSGWMALPDGCAIQKRTIKADQGGMLRAVGLGTRKGRPMGTMASILDMARTEYVLNGSAPDAGPLVDRLPNGAKPTNVYQSVSGISTIKKN